MDPTTADFAAWLADEGAKVGATIPPQPSNLLAIYGTGYAPSDAHDRTTADVLSRMQGGTAVGNLLRSLAPEVRQADDSTAASGVLSRLARTGTGLVHSGLNTAANWLEKRPEVGPDTLAPLGLAPMGGLVGRTTAAARPTVGDAAMARYLEWKHPNETVVTGGGTGRLGTHLEEVRRGESLQEDPFRANKESALGLGRREGVIDSRDPHARSGWYGDVPIEEIANGHGPRLYPYAREAYEKKLREEAKSKFRVIDGDILSDQSKASLPGTVVNAQEEYGQRNDGTSKGRGFLGELKRPDGGVSTEISVGVNIGGKEMEIPLLVPTLSKQEIRFLLENDPAPGDIPESIMQKAYDHAAGRVGKGLSPFAD